MTKEKTIKPDPVAQAAAPAEPVPKDQAAPEGVPVQETDPVAELKVQVEELTRQRDEYLDMAQRIQAEFENFRRRNRDAQQEAAANGLARALTAVVPVLDNLERAVEAAGADQGDAAGVREGVKITLRQMQEALTALGLAEIPAQHAAFDPTVHNAVMQGEPEEDCPAGCVLEVFQKGYRMGDRVIRHSMVKVAK